MLQRDGLCRCMSLRMAALAVAGLVAGSEPASAGIIGQWDFANGWNPTSGVVTAVSGTDGAALTYLPKTFMYGLPAAQSSPNPPQLAFATTGSFGIGNLGANDGTVVMRVPDARGYGLVTGLMASFQRAGSPPAKLNRYSVVMDVYVPGSTDAIQPPNYLTLVQTRLGQDNAWFIKKSTDATGVATSYGGAVTPNAWNRLALVMSLDEPTSLPRYQAFVNGALASSLVWDAVDALRGTPDFGTREQELLTYDLVPDGTFSIGTLNDSFSGLGSQSALFLFNADRNDAANGLLTGELGELYVANLQFRDDALSAGDVLALGGAAPGVVPVPEPSTWALLGAAGAAALVGRRASRRRLLTGLGGCAAASGFRSVTGQEVAEADRATTTGRAGPAATGPLAEYASAPDDSFHCRRIAGGERGAGRFVAAELVSQTWRGIPWRHQLAVYLPATLAADRPPLLLWIDGGSGGNGPVTPPEKQMGVVAAVAEAAGLPTAVVRQIPFQPLFGDRREDDLIAHTFEEFLRTGDPSWPLLGPMVKGAMAAITAATELAAAEWNVAVDGCVVAGASKRGWTSWLTAAVDRRVRGLMPMVIDMLDLPRHMQLQVASFGRPSDVLHDYISRGIDAALGTPRGRELLTLVDPVQYAGLITQPKLITLGSNDPYWPIESLGLYLPKLRGPSWVSYAPNTGHDVPPLRVAPLFAALGRHVAGVEPLPAVDWRWDDATGTCRVTADPAADELLFWTAASDSRDFREAAWRSRRLAVEDGRATATVERPATGFAAGFVECRFPRAPLPLYLSSGVQVVART